MGTAAKYHSPFWSWRLRTRPSRLCPDTVTIVVFYVAPLPWTPSPALMDTATWQEVPVNTSDAVFCSGHTVLESGDVVVVGGHKDTKEAWAVSTYGCASSPVQTTNSLLLTKGFTTAPARLPLRPTQHPSCCMDTSQRAPAATHAPSTPRHHRARERHDCG